jgi:hypothetical protein
VTLERKEKNMPTEALLPVLIKHLKREQLYEILEAITEELGEDGQCPLCGYEDVPVDEDGNEIDGDTVSDAYEWRERHSKDCPVTLIEQSFKPQ